MLVPSGICKDPFLNSSINRVAYATSWGVHCPLLTSSILPIVSGSCECKRMIAGALATVNAALVVCRTNGSIIGSAESNRHQKVWPEGNLVSYRQAVCIRWVRLLAPWLPSFALICSMLLLTAMTIKSSWIRRPLFSCHYGLCLVALLFCWPARGVNVFNLEQRAVFIDFHISCGNSD